MGIELFQLRVAIPNLPDAHYSVQFHPVVGARKWMHEAADMGVPHADVEIEIVVPVQKFSGRCLIDEVAVCATALIGSKHPASKLERTIFLTF